MAEQATLNRLVGGSTPPAVTRKAASSDVAFLFLAAVSIQHSAVSTQLKAKDKA
jgi:hypothetical protein